MNAERQIVRQAHGAGRWFPADAAELRDMVTRFIDDVKVPEVKGRIVGAIAPHAGYIYSGKVAGHVFRALRDLAGGPDEPETVVVLGFSHRAPLRHTALMDGDAIATPLGETPLDTDALAVLTGAEPRIVADYRAHAGEHSAENEIPFVQAALPSAKLVVGLIGDRDPVAIDGLVRALSALAKQKRILVVASSDMLHDPSYELVRKTDQATLRKVVAMDVTGIQGDWDYGHQTFCGIGPVSTVMKFAQAQGCNRGTLLYYRNSGDDYPESRGEWVVGYGAVIFTV